MCNVYWLRAVFVKIFGRFRTKFCISRCKSGVCRFQTLARQVWVEYQVGLTLARQVWVGYQVGLIVVGHN